MHKIRFAGQMWPSKLNLITSARTIDRNTLRMGKNISIMALECSPEFFFLARHVIELCTPVLKDLGILLPLDDSSDVFRIL